jgi:hypothetical protein
VGAAELTERLAPQAIDDIPVGHYVPLLEFNQYGRATGEYRAKGWSVCDGAVGRGSWGPGLTALYAGTQKLKSEKSHNPEPSRGVAMCRPIS